MLINVLFKMIFQQYAKKVDNAFVENTFKKHFWPLFLIKQKHNILAVINSE